MPADPVQHLHTLAVRVCEREDRFPSPEVVEQLVLDRGGLVLSEEQEQIRLLDDLEADIVRHPAPAMNPRRQAEFLRDLLNGNVVKPAVSQEFYLNVAFPKSAPPVKRSEGAEEGARVPPVVNTPRVNDPEGSPERGRWAWGH